MFIIRVRELENHQPNLVDTVGNLKSKEKIVVQDGLDEEDNGMDGSEDDSLFLDSGNERSEFSSDEEVGDSFGGPENNGSIPEKAVTGDTHEGNLGNEEHAEGSGSKPQENIIIIKNNNEENNTKTKQIEVVGQVGSNVHDYSHLVVMGPVNNLINESNQLNKEDTDLARLYDPQNGIGMALEVESQKGIKDMSDKMKFLLSKNTPLKDKLEKIKGESLELRMREMNGVEDKRKNYNITILEKRITRSQSSKKSQNEEWSSTPQRNESREDSSVSTGVSNRLEEIRMSCGFHEVKNKAKVHRKITKKEHGIDNL
ncbi:hypothetical protein L2E82_44639 [Cichorium intybus]|uniref:Uncharacterized protein n=1 Tax=Cichorium intybus TaxID=13427 RepID=A0ACB8ZQN4_CICIN|nr:hypothetical protein L2E82_44639 [Cichorium intybus]